MKLISYNFSSSKMFYDSQNILNIIDLRIGENIPYIEIILYDNF
jgi:hypothetical protein